MAAFILWRRRAASMHVREKTFGQGMRDGSVWGRQNVVARDKAEKGPITQKLEFQTKAFSGAGPWDKAFTC